MDRASSTHRCANAQHSDVRIFEPSVLGFFSESSTPGADQRRNSEQEVRSSPPDRSLAHCCWRVREFRVRRFSTAALNIRMQFPCMCSDHSA